MFTIAVKLIDGNVANSSFDSEEAVVKAAKRAISVLWGMVDSMSIRFNGTIIHEVFPSTKERKAACR